MQEQNVYVLICKYIYILKATRHGLAAEQAASSQGFSSKLYSFLIWRAVYIIGREYQLGTGPEGLQLILASSGYSLASATKHAPSLSMRYLCEQDARLAAL